MKNLFLATPFVFCAAVALLRPSGEQSAEITVTSIAPLETASAMARSVSIAGASAPSQVVTLDHANETPNDLIPTLDELLASSRFNPNQVELPRAEKQMLEELLSEQNRRIREVTEMMDQEEGRVADQKIAAGEAERYKPGDSDLSMGNHVAVNVTVSESGAWLVRLRKDELPDWDVMVDAIQQIQAETVDQVVAVVQTVE